MQQAYCSYREMWIKREEFVEDFTPLKNMAVPC